MLTYLASPYSHADPAVRQQRFEAACSAAARLMLAGEAVFSPIAHSHPVERYFDTIKDGDWWLAQDIPILRHCTAVKVLRLPGWDASKGVARELAIARDLLIPIGYVDP